MVMERSSILGLTILELLHKHEYITTVALTMSFYLTLSSDDSKNTFPNNHGGDFKVQLQHTLDLRSEPWEVALVDMIYTGQAFSNLTTEDSLITLQVSGKPVFDNDYIIPYDKMMNLWVSYKSVTFTNEVRVEGRYISHKNTTRGLLFPKRWHI